jgi:hypothetical protein
MRHKLKDLRVVFSYDVFYGTRYKFIWLLLRKLFCLYVIRLLNKELSCLVDQMIFNIRTDLSYRKVISDSTCLDFCTLHVSSLLY